jgi:pimeloyl-ACP methyl ester carboxylesterase
MPKADINGHVMYYEVHGEGDPVVCSGGWGTFCHGKEHHLPGGLKDRYSVIIFDHRGLAESTDNFEQAATTALYAADAAALLGYLGIDRAHVLGIAGIGSCLGQELAIRRPDMVRTLVLSGTWARVDEYFRAQLELWRRMHREMGFAAFQQDIVLASYDPAFYLRYRERLLGSAGGWAELENNFIAHDRLTDAALGHDTVERLSAVAAPCLVVHAGRDLLTAPRLSMPVERGIPGACGWIMENAYHVVTDRAARQAFADRMLEFLSRH